MGITIDAPGINTKGTAMPNIFRASESSVFRACSSSSVKAPVEIYFLTITMDNFVLASSFCALVSK